MRKLKRIKNKIIKKAKKLKLDLDALSKNDYMLIVNTLFFTGVAINLFTLLLVAINNDQVKQLKKVVSYNNELREVVEFYNTSICNYRYRKAFNIKGASFEPYEWCEETNNVYVEVR